MRTRMTKERRRRKKTGSRSYPVATSQTLMVWSREEEMTVSPEGWKITQETL